MSFGLKLNLRLGIEGKQKAWSPDDLGSSLVLWLDADDADTVTLNGSNVSQWDDKSGNNRHAVQATANKQPAYTTGGIGGKNSITFDGAQHNLELQNVGSLTASNKSLFIVSHPTSTTQTNYLLDIESGRQLFAANGEVFTAATNWEPAGTKFASTSEGIRAYKTGPTNLVLYENGSTINSSGQASSIPFGGAVSIGSRYSFDISFFAGEMSEIIFVNDAVSDEDRQKLEGYLAHKWGLTDKLPYDHPYKYDGRLFGFSKLWQPGELGSSLAVWYDADDASTITLQGGGGPGPGGSGHVAQWDDKSSNGYDLLQGTAAEQPEYIASGLNGKPTIRTDGSERLSSTTTSLFRNVGSATWVAVAKYVNTPDSNAMLLYCSTGANATQTRLGLTANPTGGAFLGVAGRRLDSDSYATVLSSTATSTILNSWFIEVGQGDYANAEANHWTNGTQDLTAGSFQTAGDTDDTDPLFVSVFTGTPGAPAAPAGTEIAEGIAIEGPLSTADRQKLEGYLAWKWGLESNLPIGHPYKTTPPTV